MHLKINASKIRVLLSTGTSKGKLQVDGADLTEAKSFVLLESISEDALSGRRLHVEGCGGR